MRAAMVVWVNGLRERARAIGAGDGKRRWFGALRLFTVPRLALLALAGCSGAGAPVIAGPVPAFEVGPATGTSSVSGGAPVSKASQVSEGSPASGPTVVVEAFLDAAARRDHAAMAWHFGTADGPIADRGGMVGCAVRRVGSWVGMGERCLTEREVELRMDLMAVFLAHKSYQVGRQEAVAGRGRAATRVEVQVEAVGRGGVAVPFVVIEADDGRWLVEEVGLGRLTG